MSKIVEESSAKYQYFAAFIGKQNTVFRDTFIFEFTFTVSVLF